MKSRFTVVSILALLGILVFSASAGAVTWNTYLEDIIVPSGTVDIDLTYYHNGTTSNYTRSVALPCNASELTGATTFFNITADGGNITYNLSVNGNACNTTSHMNGSETYSWTLTALIAADKVSNTDKYLNFTFGVNSSTNDIRIDITADDAAFSPAWLSTYVSVAEAILTSPEVNDKQAYSYFSVKDRVAVNNNLNYTITDISLALTYPSHNLSTSDSTVDITSLATGSISYNNLSYQKYGPYVTGTIGEDIDGDDHEVTIRVSSHEVLTRLVDWDFDETAEDYEDYFATINFNTLVVKLNGVKIDWDEGTVEMDGDTLVEGVNRYEFSWSEAAAPVVTPAPGAWDWIYDDYGTGIAVWMWIIITATIACIIIAVAYAKKK